MTGESSVLEEAHMKHHSHHQRGQALVLIVLAIVGLIGLTALAVDGGNAFTDRRHAQGAADAAALAAALAKVHDQNWSQAGLARAADNEYTNDGVRSTVTVSNPPGPDCDGAIPNPVNLVADPNDKIEYYIQVIIRSNVDTYFAPVVGVDQVHNCVEAIARARPAVTTPIAYGNAMVSLHQSECASFWVQGTAETIVTGSGVFVNSNCASGNFQAFTQIGDGTLSADSVCVVGGATYEAGEVTPPPQTSCGTQLPYPPEYIWPQPTCSVDGTRSDGILTPGNIPGSWLGADVTLQPGIYCISGDATINANDVVTGVGVLLYFMDGGLHINGGAEINLSAPTTGDYAGLLIYLPLTNDSLVLLNGNANSTFTGTILAPASEIQINGTGSSYGYHCQIIGLTIELIGTADTSIFYDDSANYDITLPPTIEVVR
ncbi:MAG: hypothetical protein FD146_690 [Anaerolineaceae bacterium]|nr:MAG: hypothetical protein FD146_690 [Anaerolineaceae bacterium]